MNTEIPRILRRHGPAYAVSYACDCACSAIVSSRTPDLAVERLLPDVLQKAPGLHTSALSQEYQLAFLPSGGGIGDGLAVLNSSACEMLAHFDHPRSIASYPASWQVWDEPVIETALGDLLDLGFLTASPAPPVIVNEMADVLSVWLHLTDRCNLRCAYCYLPHARADMSSVTGRAAIDATFRSALAHGYSTVKPKYAGGEPLLRFPLVVELHRYAQSLAQQHGLKLDGVILSNGTLLTADMIETIQLLGMRLMISLDGLGTYHDSQRCFPDGRGSFAAVARAIELARVASLVPDISITVSGRNIKGLPDVVAWVLERDLPFSLNFYREHSKSDWQSDLRLDEDCIIDGMLAAFKVIEHNLPRHSLLALLADRANLSVPHVRTCSAGRDYLVFDTQGRIAKCQMALAQPVTDCSNPDPLGTVRSSALGLQNLKVDEKAGCQKCQWRYWCGGGCPLETYQITGRYDVKSINCNIYKALYPEVLRLEGLRLLKYMEDN